MVENSNDSFQLELEDYIRDQKARGLQPNVCFRKATENSVNREEGHGGHRPLMPEQRLFFRRPPNFPSTYTKLKAVESQLLHCSKMYDLRQRMEYISYCQKNQDHFFSSTWPAGLNMQGKISGSHRASQHKGNSSIFSEEHSNTCQAGSKENHQKRGYDEVEDHPEKEQISRKRSQYGNGDCHRQHKRKASTDPARTEKHREKDSTKAARGSHRKKKEAGRESTEERDLWDEAILGGSY
ncbi:PREDICTED: zinc finger matrin-type protein 1-like [Elephantulus edwardii]|uniref:zinc finger matrin-type protein 1-like n=1 Tax=Elephantulus edwardii TaxID=28737 RepID=UPI0003F0BADC|nr:PREDICTED: zinc finger matrin-type protein 1-like [Elephantulus edwardii]